MELDVMKKLIKKYETGHTNFILHADEAERYYRNKTDILYKGKEKTDDEGNPIRNANNRIPRNFHGLIVNQKASYAFTAPPCLILETQPIIKKSQRYWGMNMRRIVWSFV